MAQRSNEEIAKREIGQSPSMHNEQKRIVDKHHRLVTAQHDRLVMEDSMREPKIRPWPCALHPESGHTKETRPRCRACMNANRRQHYQDHGESLRSVYSSWLWQSKRRGYAVTITFGQWSWLRRQPCVYKIDETPSKSGIDRKDSSKGYIRGNCQPCCARHNLVKGDVFTHEQMFDLVQRYHIVCGDTEGGRKRSSLPSLIVRPT